MKFESQLQIVTAAGVPPFTVNQTAAVINLNADLLDGQHGAYYLDCANFTGTLAAGRLSGSYPISVTGYSYAVFVADTRDDATTPQTINRGVVFDFKANSSNGLNDGGNYFGLLTFRQYGSGTDWTGGSSHQLGFTDNGNVWQRSGSNTTWGAWKKLLDSSNYGGYSTFTGTVTGTNFSGPGTGLTGTAAALNIGGTAAIATNIADGAVSTSAKIAASVVTYAKIQNVAVSSVLGNSSASVAQAPQELSMATLAGMLSGQTMNIAGSSTSCTGNAATASKVSISTGVIADVLAPGSGTYNRHQVYANSSEFGIEGALATDAIAGAKLPIYLTWRGGYAAQGGFKLTGPSAAELGGYAVIHANNYSSYALPLTGGTLTGALTGTAASFSGLFTQSGEAIAVDACAIVHNSNVESYYQLSRRLQAFSHLGSTTTLEVEVITLGNGDYNGEAKRTTWRISSRGSLAVTRHDENGGVNKVSLRILNDTAVPDVNGQDAKYVVGLICGNSSDFVMVFMRARFLQDSGSSRWVTIARLATAAPSTSAGSAMTYSSGWVANTGFTNTAFTEVVPAGKFAALTLTGLLAANVGLYAPGVDVNYAAPDGWTASTGNGAGYYGGDFTVNGDAVENTRSFKDTPYASPGLVWATTNNDATSNDDGGWNKTITGLNASKTYRSIVWVRRSSALTNGNFYHGCGSSTTLNLNNTSNTNPYFGYFGLATLTQGVWYLSVGYIHSNGDGSTTSYGGLYDANTGQKVVNYTDYKMAANATDQVHRVYLYYSTDPTALLDFWGPRFEEVNGNEPSIGALLGFLPSPRFSGTPTVGDSVIIHAGNYTSYPPARWATARTISITGDVTGTSGGFDGTANLSFAVSIANSAVTYAKIQNVAAASVLGNSSASVAQAPAALSMATLAGMLSGQTMNIVGSSTSCTGNAATATNVAWSGITSKPTTLAGFGITDALDTSATAQTKSGNLTVNSALTSGGAFYAATTVQYSNRQQIYTVYYGGGQDLNWKKIADITIGVGLYRAVTFRVDVVDNQGNFGWNSDCYPMTFFASCRRSGGVQDSYNDAWVTGPVSDYVRVVKTALGVYELQIRQLADWQTYVYTAEATINSGTVVTYVSGTPPNGSTTGTVYAPTIDWTQKLAKLVVAGSATFASQITSSVATGTAPFSVASTTAVTNLNSDLLDGQHGAYYENRDTTAVGFSGGTLTLTRATGNLTVSLDGRYLTGNQSITLSGDVTGTGTTAITTTIPNSTITNAKLNTMGAGTIKGNNGAVANSPSDLTAAQVATMLSGQTMNISGSSTSCTGNAASASSVPWSGITSKPTTLSGYGITDALPLSGGTLTGTLYFTDSTNGIYKGGGRLSIRSESTDDVANFASYGLYLPKTGQTAGLYVESPIEARGGLRIGISAGSGTITVGADTAATANRLAQRDASGGINAVSFSGAGTGLTGTASSLTAGAVPWSGVTGKPTTLSGYGITDAMYQVDPNGFTQGDIYGSGNMQRLWGTDSVQNLIAFRPPTTVEYTVDGVNWVATTISSDVFDGKVFGKWGGFNMNVGSNIGAWTKVRMTWVNFGYHFFSHFTLCHSTNGHSMNFVFYKSDLNGVFGAESYRVNGISSWPGYTFTSHVNVSGWWDTRDVRMVFELIGNNGPTGYPNNAITIGHIGIMGGYSSFNRVFDWDGNRNITLYGNLTLPGNVSATGTVSGSSFTGAGTGLTGTANSLSVGGYSARWATGRTIAITGDVTGTSAAFDGTANLSFAATIANSAVTYAKIQNVAVSSVLGNSSASVAQAPAALSMATLAGMLSGQTMNIAGSSTSCTGNAATATNVAWSGITSKPTTLSGFGITDALPISGGTLTGGLTGTSANFSSDVTWSGSNSGNARAVRIGYSGGNYGGISYGINYTATAGSHTYAFADAVTRIDLADGIQVYSAATGTVGAAVSWTTLLTAYRGNASLQWKGANVLDANNYTNYTLPRGGSWYGVSLPGSRWGGFSANGGEVVFGQDLPNTGQMGVLIDGCYIAGENNGFWSLANSNDWTTRRGMYFDGTYLRFDYNSATAYFSNASINGNQVIHAGNYSSYALPLSGGTLTGTLTAPTLQLSNGFQIQQGASNYGQFNTWVHLNGSYGFYSGVNSAHLYPNNGSYGSWRMDGSRNGWGGIEFGNGVSLMMGSDTVGFHQNTNGWLFRVHNGTGFIHKGSWGGGTTATIFDSENYTAYLNNTYLRAAGHPGYGDWNTFGNTAQTVHQMYQENFNLPTSTGSSNFPTNASYKYGTLINFSSGNDARAQVYISHAGNDLVFRGGWGTASWHTWNRCVTDVNFPSFGTHQASIGNSLPTTVFMSTDANIRQAPFATAKAHLGITSKWANSRPNLTSDSNYWTGVMGWGTTDWNTVFDWGSGFTDSWSTPANNPGDTSHHLGIQAVHYTNGSGRYGWQMVNGVATNRWWLRDVWGGGFSSWREVIHSGNYHNYTPTLTGAGASGTWGINITGNAATATNGFTVKPGWAGNQNLILEISNFNNSLPSGFYQGYQATNSPTATWYNLINVRHSNTGNDHGFQLAMSYYDEVLWSRTYSGGTGANNGTFTAWRAHLHSGNYNSYAPTLTGGGASGSWGINITGSSASCTGNAATCTTASGIADGAVSTTAKLANSVVTYAKIQNVTAYTVLGNSSPSAAQAPVEINMASLASMLSGNTMNISGSSTSCSGNAATATTSVRSTIEDTRAAQRTPNNYDDYRASYEFTNQITGIGDWHSAITLQGWHDGYAAWQIIGPSSTSAHENFYLRSGVNTTWNTLRTILHSGNYTSYSPSLTGSGASGTWGINITGSSASCTGNAATASAVAASGITGQTGMWTSAARPGPYRLYRRDNDSNYSVQTYWTGSYWRLYGYSGDTAHADTHVGYADSAGSVSTIADGAVSTTAKLANSVVTYAKIQNVGASSVLGNTSASVSQAPQEITFANLGPYINGVARAWVTFNENPSTGAITVNASFGISSVTRLALGVYQINFSSAFADANYAVSGTIGYESISAYTNGGYLALTRTATPKATTSCEVCASYGGTNYNARYVHVVFHR